MQINSDFSQTAALQLNHYNWRTTPQVGVQRVMLDRIGGEKARATTVVRYAPGSTFPNHSHPGGEEVLVLSGIFSDQSGDYSQGWYLRNPPGSSHAPSSLGGTTIFVKLWQMSLTEATHTRINTNDSANWVKENNYHICPLYQDKGEVTQLIKLTPHQCAPHHLIGQKAIELFVLTGSIFHNKLEYKEGSWLRVPSNKQTLIKAGNKNATIYLKVGNFKNIS
ncbi:cupin domain-containing protein [Psychrosphaera haliotis]|uniref:Anti-sigma factor n=1 Tax=Psychrosphaera haliotis TaxID=555083 RepID=A0A6N8FBW9_9GAMM|nr:cupin domain-containing protein [Psychrosphaera haliotis]MUH72242.1 anti-sigma factor [Psychrosphaera haliotis]